MDIVIKAGCILVNKENNMIGLIYRDNYNDYSFPKGHLEVGETIPECAIRETNEETKRSCEIIDEENAILDIYETPRGEYCKCYMYIALDTGVSDNTSEEVHDLVWVKFEEVEDKLSYDSLKKVWNIAKDDVLKLLNS